MTQRKCVKCGLTLPITEYPSWSARVCKECAKPKESTYNWSTSHAEACKKYRQKKRASDPSYIEAEKKRAKTYYHSVYQQRRDEFLNQFKTPCLRCGEEDTACIVFHHIDPEQKSFCIGGGSLGKHSEEEVVAEVKKCICLCENCHRKFHHQYGHQLQSPKQSLYQFIQEKENQKWQL